MSNEVTLLKNNILPKLNTSISLNLTKSISQYEKENFKKSLTFLIQSLKTLLEDEIYLKYFPDNEEAKTTIEMIRDLNSKDVEVNREVVQNILRINEKGKDPNPDSIIIESCYSGAILIYEWYLDFISSQENSQDSVLNKKLNSYDLEEILEMYYDEAIAHRLEENLDKLVSFKKKFPADKDLLQIYLLLLTEKDQNKLVKEIKEIHSKKLNTIRLSAICIICLADSRLISEAREYLSIFKDSYSTELDFIYTELYVFMKSYFQTWRERDLEKILEIYQRIEERDDPFYTYIMDSYKILQENFREIDVIKNRNKGIYQYKILNFLSEYLGREAEKIQVESQRKEQERLEILERNRKEEEIRKREEEKLKRIQEEILKIESGSKTKVNSLQMEFVLIPSGSFFMGEPTPNHPDETPYHKIQISRPFYMGKFPVTQKEWEMVMGTNPSKFRRNGNLAPVEKVNQSDIQEFLKKLNQKEGLSGSKSFRLPTEAEWEYACRAQTTQKYFFGKDESLLPEFSIHLNNSNKSTAPVGQKKPNPWGLYDLYGNVWEWCKDTYDSKFYEKSAVVDPICENPSSSKYVIRGGSFLDLALISSSTRYACDYKVRSSDLGFRLVWVH